MMNAPSCQSLPLMNRPTSIGGAVVVTTVAGGSVTGTTGSVVVESTGGMVVATVADPESSHAAQMTAARSNSRLLTPPGRSVRGRPWSA